jgi:ribonuclease R
MQSFEEHQHIDCTGTGMLTYIKPDLLVVTDCITNIVYPITDNNRGMDGDQVYYKVMEDGLTVHVVGIYERHQSLKKLVGVLQLTSTKMYGVTKRQAPIYSFVPLSWRYPNFMVPSTVKAKWKKKGPVRNVYVLIEFAEWTPFQKYPSGRCLSIIGSITESEIEDVALLHKNNICIKKHQKITLQPDITANRHSYDLDCNIITIDPAGSTDLDDAIHLDDTHIYVHIADVDSVFQQDGPYEEQIKKRLTSVYADKTYHMLPSGFSDDLLSLNENGWKNTMTVILDRSLTGISFHMSKIRVKKCMTYEQAQELKIADDMYPIVHALADLTGTTDTHKIVERIMVSANDYVGNVTADRGPSLLRVMTDVPSTVSVANPILGYLKFRSLTGAKYVAYTKSTEPGTGSSEVYHGALNKKHYTHFTSPIRRYSDLIIHRLLKNPDSYTFADLNDIAEQLNESNLKTKRYYRDSAVMTLYHSIDHPIATQGYIVDYTEENNNIHIYLIDYELEYRDPLFSDKLCHIITVENTDKEIVITNRQLDQTWNLPKYTLIDIDLSSDWTENRLNRKVIMRLSDIADMFI